MRRISLNIGGTPVGKARTWAYPKGYALGQFEIPTYRLRVAGTNGAGRRVLTEFEVLRFGVSCKDGRTAQSVGLADRQTHSIGTWIPTYRVHSASSPENGGWQVFGNFLVHDGPDDANELFASIGCIEVMGPSGFIRFNDLLIELSGTTGATRDEQLHNIARAHVLTITYDRAARPPLVPLK